MTLLTEKPTTYVYEGTEVVMTGRTAQKPSTLSAHIMLIMYEIQPADKETITWKKWVKMDQLFIVD